MAKMEPHCSERKVAVVRVRKGGLNGVMENCLKPSSSSSSVLVPPPPVCANVVWAASIRCLFWV